MKRFLIGVTALCGSLALIGVHRLVAIIAPRIPLASVQGHAVAGIDFGKVLHLDDGLHIVGRDDSWITRLFRNGQHFR